MIIGAEKNVSSFYGENSEIVNYSVKYLLSNITDKLERVSEYYSDINEKIIEPKSKKYKIAVKDVLIENYIESLDKLISGIWKVSWKRKRLNITNKILKVNSGSNE